LSYPYLAAEMLWYLSGDLSVSGIKKYASMWSTIADPHGNVNSNYGHIVFFQPMKNYDNKNQFYWCLESLIKDPDSRQALINFNQPKHKSTDTKDFVCTTYMQFLIRDRKLYCFSHSRSNDLIYGFCYDIAFFCFLHNLMHRLLVPVFPGLELGRYTHSATSMHVYKRHYAMIGEIANSIPCLSGGFKGLDKDLYEAIMAKSYKDVLFFDCLKDMKKIKCELDV